MSDDELTAEDLRKLREKATVKLEKVGGDKRAQEVPTVSYKPDKASIDALVAETKERQKLERDQNNDRTEVLSRDDIFRNAARDRAAQRGRKSTVPLESVVTNPLPRNHPDETTPISAEQIEEVKNLQPHPDESDAQEVITTVETEAHRRYPESGELDGTTEFARFEEEPQGLDSVDFPARITQNFQISIPTEQVEEFELEAGDIVIVTLRKVRG